jgi:SAM-dependent methyltransferase
MSVNPEKQGTLSDKEYWDCVHAGRLDKGAPVFVRAAKKILGPSAVDMMRSYENYILFHVIYPAFLPSGEEIRAIEIGSAPGRHLVRMRHELGCDVWGLEYSPEGAETNRKLFAVSGIDPGHVIEADLFDDGLDPSLTDRFDIVISRGFIEHFDDPAGAIDRHLRLLRPGGTLVISIPNMRGANYLQSLLFCRRLIPLHNREIMRLKSFRSLFDPGRLESVFCGYYGTFRVNFFIDRRSRPMRLAGKVAEAAQAPLNLLFRLALRDRGLDTSTFSPNLLFIGRKRH